MGQRHPSVLSHTLDIYDPDRCNRCVSARAFADRQTQPTGEHGHAAGITVVCAGVWLLRRRNPTLPRPFRTPLVRLVPILGIASAFYLMSKLPPLTWDVFLIWLAIGLMIYFGYFTRHSKVQHGAGR